MPLNSIQIENYRSVRSLVMHPGKVTVVVGPNGCGKTNLYRSLYLLWAAANGHFAASMAEEGGMPSVLWAGPRSKNEPIRVTFAVQIDFLKYKLECGLPQKLMFPTAFKLDPEVKEETVEIIDGKKRIKILQRKSNSVMAHDASGKRIQYGTAVGPDESILAALKEPQNFPELSALRQQILQWRFYHSFRTDTHSLIRQPQIGVRTTALSHDGRDLAAALQTIIEIGDADKLYQSVEDAFPGASLQINFIDGRFTALLHMAGFERPFDSRELSDGTLHYLCLLAALLSPRPPAFMAINEPESSIHPDLLEPLAKLVAHASKYSQIWITTHSKVLSNYVQALTRCQPIELEKVNGKTRIVGQKSGLNDDEEADDRDDTDE